MIESRETSKRQKEFLKQPRVKMFVSQLADGFASIERNDVIVTEIKLRKSQLELLEDLNYVNEKDNEKFLWGAKISLDRKVVNPVIFGGQYCKVVFNSILGKWCLKINE